MGIVAEKTMAEKSAEAKKPTVEEVELTDEFVATLLAAVPLLSKNAMVCEAVRVHLPVYLAAYRLRITERVCAGEGYETPQDLEKRQTLSQKCAGLEKTNAELQAEIALYKSVFSRATSAVQPTTNVDLDNY